MRRSVCPRVCVAAFALTLSACSAINTASVSPQAANAGALSKLRGMAAISPSPPPRPLPPGGPGWLSALAASGSGLVYVASGGEVLIYPKDAWHPKPIGRITDGVTAPYGLHVDSDGNLFVVNWYGGPSVQFYRRGTTSPAFTYSQGLSRPLYVVADVTRVFVGDANTGEIVEYRKGNAKPVAILNSLGGEVDGMAFDANGDLYAAYRDETSGIGGVEVFPRGSRQGTDLGIPLTGPQGLVVDAAGNIIAVETQGVNAVDVFPPGQTQPSQRISIEGIPVQIQLGRLKRRLYISAYDRVVRVSPYPTLAQPTFKIRHAGSGEQGIAVSPDSKP